MKVKFESDILLKNIDEAIHHSKEYDLPLESIELTEMEWRLFMDHPTLKYTWPDTWDDFLFTEPHCHYKGVLIYQEGHKPKGKK